MFTITLKDLKGGKMSSAGLELQRGMGRGNIFKLHNIVVVLEDNITGPFRFIIPSPRGVAERGPEDAPVISRRFLRRKTRYARRKIFSFRPHTPVAGPRVYLL